MKFAVLATVLLFVSACDDDKPQACNCPDPPLCNCPEVPSQLVGTVAWDGTTIAASDNQLYVVNGFAIGVVLEPATGDVSWLATAIANGVNPTGPWRAIVVTSSQAWIMDANSRVEIVRSQNVAIGSGEGSAWSAMKLGADAVSAVSLAVTQDPNSNAPIANAVP